MEQRSVVSGVEWRTVIVYIAQRRARSACTPLQLKTQSLLHTSAAQNTAKKKECQVSAPWLLHTDGILVPSTPGLTRTRYHIHGQGDSAFSARRKHACVSGEKGTTTRPLRACGYSRGQDFWNMDVCIGVLGCVGDIACVRCGACVREWRRKEDEGIYRGEGCASVWVCSSIVFRC